MADDKKESLKDILRDLGENTSVHGIPKILASKHRFLKVFWLLVFLGTSVYLCLQMYALFKDYYSYPVETTVSLKFNAIKYPAVTFCNMNPLRKSKLEHTPQSLQDTLKPKSRGSTSSSSSGSSGGNMTGSDYDYYGYEYSYDYDNQEYQNELNDYFSNPSPLQQAYLATQNPDAPKDKWTERIDNFKAEYRKVTHYDKQEYGHQLNDMVVSCSFNKRRCNMSYFHHSVTSDFGNCYTISSDNLVARKAGHLYGLQLILNLEVSEYITSLSSAYGIKLVVHRPGTTPYPSIEGLTLSSKQETTISLRTIEVHRLGGDYGECRTSNTSSSKLYSQPSCLNLCVLNNIIQQCNCMPSTSENSVLNDLKYLHLNYCEEEDFEKLVCQFRVEKYQLEGKLNCDCPTPCNEIVYTKTLSSRIWPHDEYVRQFLMVKVCAKNLTSAIEACDQYKKNPKNFTTESVVDNFLAVNIYFEDVNYEVITESPKYDEFQVLASVGGTLGLFVGASVLSFVEIIHIILEVCIFLFRPRVRKNEVQGIDDDIPGEKT